MRRPAPRRAAGWQGARGRACAALGAAATVACAVERSPPAARPAYDGPVAALLETRCGPCHGPARREAGWGATAYLDAIGCVAPSGAPAVLPPDGRAPLLRALDASAHRGVVGDGERRALEAWVANGAPARAGVVHDAAIIDPRAPGWHGTLLRSAGWAPLLDADHPDACGRCHAGAPARPPGVILGAPSATACTSCHDGPDGALACTTCHGPRGFPPRDACFFADARSDAHAAHVGASPPGPEACAACHPAPGAALASGSHLDGVVDVTLASALVGGGYDRASSTCSVSCHERGGSLARPGWFERGPLGCGSCHGSPPPAHYPGSCSSCHPEANAEGSALAPGGLHLNGRVDVGDGGGRCGACHGSGDDPWPRTAAHPAHRAPLSAAPVACASCHPARTALGDADHLDGVVQVVFAGRATDRGASPSWASGRCASVACHGAGLADGPDEPSWLEPPGRAGACGACHGLPPAQHVASFACDRSTCHGEQVERNGTSLTITPAGRARHIDGVIDAGGP
ncbi:MAG: CxxxxCH/CxxCH domain-containing protein [Polyangiaceae bacterium]|nr:CxxxxCH/CxxCH domain-containing protein [Polyangiaceae bacterium]